MPSWNKEYEVKFKLTVESGTNETDMNIIHFTTGDEDVRIPGVWVDGCEDSTTCDPKLRFWTDEIDDLEYDIKYDVEYLIFITQRKHVGKVGPQYQVLSARLLNKILTFLVYQ